jgi:hypothetical protein
MEKGIYGDASDGKGRTINKLLIDDQHRHLWRRGIIDDVINPLGNAAPRRPGSPGSAASRRPGDDAER